jgi:hypothetical protein
MVALVFGVQGEPAQRRAAVSKRKIYVTDNIASGKKALTFPALLREGPDTTNISRGDSSKRLLKRDECLIL